MPPHDATAQLDRAWRALNSRRARRYIQPDPHAPPAVNKNKMADCESAQMGPVDFNFNYTFTVLNPNYITANIRRGKVGARCPLEC